MKKLLTGIAVFITMAVICIFSAGAETFGDYNYEVLSDGTVEIVAYLGETKNLEIPSQINGKKVTSIGACAFEECNSIVSITIPSSVTYIGNYAFYYCESLKSVTIHGNITRIGDGTFGNCSALSSITIPESVTSIGESAFYYCSSLTSITIPEGVTSIGESAFCLCTSLASVNIPDSVTDIGWYAFRSCKSLTSLTIPDNVTSLGNYTFYYCSSLSSITIPDSVTYIGEEVFENCDCVIISCFEGSYAEQYAMAEGISYKLITPYITGFKLSSRNYNSITLSWNKRNNATGYILQMYKNGAWTNVANIKDNTITSYKVTDLTANTSYKFRAVAYVTKGGATNYSKYTSALTVSTAPAMTTGFAITGRGSDFLTVSWTKNAGASGYLIQEQIDGVWTKVVAIKDNTTTSYKITGLKPNSFHRYRMVAYKTDANGTCYGKYTGSVPGYTAPAAVTGLEGFSATDTSINLKWNKVASADGYVIDIYKDGKWSQLAKLTSNAATSYKATELKSGTLYKFRIKSYATNGTLTINSTYSSALTVAADGSRVSNLRMTNRGTDFISVRWDKNENADGYMVYIYDGTKWTCVKTLTSASSVSHKITGLASGKAYKITVKAYKTVGGTKLISDTATISANTL